MSKIQITITNRGDKQYAVFKVDPFFLASARAAGYFDLPRNGEQMEIQPDDELVTTINRKIAEAEAAIERLEAFLRSPAETRELDVCGHRVAIEFSPSNGFLWKAKVFLPLELRKEANIHSLLGEHIDNWHEEECGFSLIDFTRNKEEFFQRVQEEMTKIAEEVEALRKWRSQPSQHYNLPGNVQVEIKPHSQWHSYYEAEIVAPRALIDKAKECGLKLGDGTWWPKGNHHVEMTWPLRSADEATIFIAKLQNNIEEVLATEIVAQYSI